MSKQQGLIGLIAIGVLILAVVAALIAFPVYYVKGTERTETFTVKKTERIENRNSQGSKYLIFADTGTYENTDSFLNGKYNSSDLYGSLENGHKYTCKVYGWRIQVFSQYPNVVSCEEAK